MHAAKTDAFLTMLEAHKGILYKVVHAYCRNRDQREDLAQEIILQLWLSFARYDDRYQYSTWVYRIALNVAISGFRKHTRRQTISHPLGEDMLLLPDDDSSQEPSSALALLHRFIDELKPLDKALILLMLEEKSHKEIAAITGISESNVATRLHRIKQSLRQKFQNNPAIES